MRKWNNLPNEIRMLIIEEAVKEEEPAQGRWMMVNRQWYDQYQSKTYKSISIRLDNTSCRILVNIIHSRFQPGKWVTSIEFKSLKSPAAAFANFFSPTLGFGGDPLYLLMAHSPHVKHVKLPIDKGVSQMSLHTKDWIYFTNALIFTNTWKLQSLSLERIFYLDCVAKSQYYKCAFHLRKKLRQLTLTRSMIASEYYSCLHKFERLSSLVVHENVVNNLQDNGTRLLQFLPALEEITIHFSPSTEEENTQQQIEKKRGGSSKLLDIRRYFQRLGPHQKQDQQQKNTYSSTTTNNNNSTSNIYPNIRKLSLKSYWQANVLSTDDATQQQYDILNLKRFTNLDYLHVDVPFGSPPTFLIDSSILAHIDSCIPSYDINFSTVRSESITEYLDIYCNSIKQQHHHYQNDGNSRRRKCNSGSSNIKKFDLYISFDSKSNNGRGNTTIIFKRQSKESNGEIYFCIGFDGMDAFNRITAMQRILNHHNDVINGIYLDLQPLYYSKEEEEEEIGLYILGMHHFKNCNRLIINRGAFIEAPIEIRQQENLVVDHHHSQSSNITYLQFKKCYFNHDDDSPLRHISDRYSYLQHFEFKDCIFRNSVSNLPYKAKADLPGTSIDTLLLYQSDASMGEGLVYKMNHTLFISVVTASFSKSFICTSKKKGSKVQEISIDLLEVLRESMDVEMCACFVQVFVQSLKTLVFKVDKDKYKSHFDITISLP